MLNRIGATLSAICAIHCLLMPLLVGVLPILGVAWVSDEAELYITFSAVFIIGFSILWGYRKHNELRIIALFVGALGLILAGLVSENEWFHGVGMMVLLGAYFLSVRLCKSCAHDHGS